MSGGMDRDPMEQRINKAVEARRAVTYAPAGPNVDQKPDPVNHPAHYTLGGIEVIDAIEAWKLTFKLANVIKYVARADHKGKPLEDLKKAQWYLNREIAQREAAEAKAKVSSGG